MKKTIFTGLVLLLTSSLICASEIIVPAKQFNFDKGKAVLSVFYNKSYDTNIFNVRNMDDIDFAGKTLFVNMVNDIEAPGQGDMYGAKCFISSNEGMTYWIKAGAGKYEIEFPSTSVKNRLNSENNGIIVGVGVRKNIIPYTVVTPAVALDLGIDYHNYHLNKLHIGDGDYLVVSDKLEFTKIQFAMIVSKKYRKFEPYAALGVVRTYSAITNNDTLKKAAGIKDNAVVYAGLKMPVSEVESIVIEGNFVSNTNISIGWNIEF
jgi:hypothetical protein